LVVIASQTTIGFDAFRPSTTVLTAASGVCGTPGLRTAFGGPAVLLTLPSAQPTTAQSPIIKQLVASLIWVNIPLHSNTRNGAKNVKRESNESRWAASRSDRTRLFEGHLAELRPILRLPTHRAAERPPLCEVHMQPAEPDSW
jgi:hypothetical protein